MRYSRVVIDYAQNQRNRGKVENPDGSGNHHGKNITFNVEYKLPDRVSGQKSSHALSDGS